MFDKLDAKVDQLAGSAKETAGKVLGDKSLEAEGLVDNLVGKAKEATVDAKDALEGAVDSLKNKLS